MRCNQFVGEPRGAVYRSLLREVCRRHGVRFSLVCRENTALADHPSKALKQLRAWCVEERDVNQWPGTLLLGHSGRLYIFDVNAESIDVLCHAVDGLFGWLGPEEPEDLAFYRNDGRVLLESIAHEEDARVYLSQDEWESLPATLRDLLSAC